jgi:hypothetical protein
MEEQDQAAQTLVTHTTQAEAVERVVLEQIHLHLLLVMVVLVQHQV